MGFEKVTLNDLRKCHEISVSLGDVMWKNGIVPLASPAEGKASAAATKIRIILMKSEQYSKYHNYQEPAYTDPLD